MMNGRSALLVALILTTLAGAWDSRQATAQTVIYGPSAYQAYDTNPPNGGDDPSPNISPFAVTFGPLRELDGIGTPAETTALPDFRGLTSSVSANARYFFLEDMEDGQFDVPGVTYSGNGHIRTESGRNGSVASGVTGPNSVDEDNNGGVNREGRQPQAASFRQNPGQFGFIDFSALGGNLPTHVGIVAMALEATFPTVTVQFLDSDDFPIATINAQEPFTDCDYGGDSACFMGVEHSEGISALSFTSDWDWDHLQYGFVGDDPPPPATNFQWIKERVGDWNDAANWNPSNGPPNSKSHTVRFPSQVSQPGTIAVDSAVTVNSIQIDHVKSYIIAGSASVNLEAASADGVASLSVDQGTHEFQVWVNLLGDTTVDVSSGAKIEFNNRLNLTGHTLTKTGAGEMSVNNVFNTEGGMLACVEGVCSGSGTIAGDVINVGGTISPGNSQQVVNVASVPEACSFVLLATATAGLAFVPWRRRYSQGSLHCP